MFAFDNVPAGLIALLSKIDLYQEVRWQSYEEDDRRKPTEKLTEAVCGSSRLREQPSRLHFDGESPHVAEGAEQHYLMLDLDVAAWLVPSSTPGHSHLYVEREIPWRNLVHLLRALAACGIIEIGYASASIERRSTTLRLPWVEKEREEDVKPGVDVARRVFDQLYRSDSYDQLPLALQDDFNRALDHELETLRAATKAADDALTLESPPEEISPTPEDPVMTAHNCTHLGRTCSLMDDHDWHDWVNVADRSGRQEFYHCPGRRVARMR